MMSDGRTKAKAASQWLLTKLCGRDTTINGTETTSADL
jgi:hypothetical protein